MADIKFNFYNTYINYYRNINDINKFNIFISLDYQFFNKLTYYIEVITQLYSIKLYLFVKYEYTITQKIDENIIKSLKKINKSKFFVKTIFKNINCDYKLYNLFFL